MHRPFAAGDLVAIGSEPVRTLELLAELPNALFVQGNTERYLLTGERPYPSLDDTRADPDLLPRLVEVAQSFAWTHGAVAATGWRDWLAELPIEHRTTIPDETKVLLTHVAPGLNDRPGIHPAHSVEKLLRLLAKLRCANGHRMGKPAYGQTGALEPVMAPDEADIELAKPCDSDAVSALVHAAYAHYVSLIDREPAPMTVDYQALIARGVVYVLRDRGQREIHGVLVMFPQRDAMLLDNLAIRPDYQKQGLGRRLLQYAEQQALRRGLREIQLYTNEAMTENIGYYKRAGYEEIARRTEQGFRRVFMRKVLSPGTGSR